jgi:hypothetical protein
MIRIETLWRPRGVSEPLGKKGPGLKPGLKGCGFRPTIYVFGKRLRTRPR